MTIDAERIPDVVIALREWLSATAVQIVACNHGGADSSVPHVQLMTIAGIIAEITGEDSRELQREATARARRIFQIEDWRRELTLYNNFNGRFWHGRS